VRYQQLPEDGAGAGLAVLACGAWLKNAACLVQGGQVHWSPVHGDLDDPDNCAALSASVEALAASAGITIAGVAHDLHPDFYSTRVAREIADRLGVPAIPVQHHHAHIGALAAEHGLREPLIGLALDGVGYGTDGTPWGGELLLVDGPQWRRLGHLRALALPGGDTAAREPWRMAAAVLHALGRGEQVEQRFGASAGSQAARAVAQMLERGVRCPATTSAGRWFDAAAGALGISVRQEAEAQAAIALETLARDYLASHGEPPPPAAPVLHADGTLDLLPVLDALFALADSTDPQAVARGAAQFHLALADALARWAGSAARRHGIRTVALGGGCFFNRLLTERLSARLEQAGLRVARAGSVSCGDAGLALGQAWVARQQLAAASVQPQQESIPCV
jgi:hydrogenase maturation protein HypF